MNVLQSESVKNIPRSPKFTNFENFNTPTSVHWVRPLSVKFLSCKETHHISHLHKTELKMAARGLVPSLLAVLNFIILQNSGHARVLTPPYFNLAEARRIYASATCGVGVAEPELFCRLTGATSDKEEARRQLLQGQLCDHCDVSVPEQSHPAEFAIDGSERWWQSPPLSRGLDFNKVNLTINLGQVRICGKIMIINTMS